MQELTASLATAARRSGRPASGLRRAVVAAELEETRRFFLDNYPRLLDGALPFVPFASSFIREACATLSRGEAGGSLLPAAVLRDTLDSLAATPRPFTKAGMTAVGPRRVRVWWDRALLGGIDDILAAVDRPRLVLRFYDVTGLDAEGGRWNNLFDIDIDIAEPGKSVDFWSPDRVYVVDLGLVHADGRFQALARTNTAEIPRENKGNKHPGRSARSAIAPRRPAAVTPEAEDYAWVEAGPDSPNRDIAAEALIRRLYRLFLDEGPRALRRAVRPERRPESDLRRDFAARSQSRARHAPRPSREATPAVLVARLDRGRPATPTILRYLPAPAALPSWHRLTTGLPLAAQRYYTGLVPLVLCGAAAPPVAERSELAVPAPDTVGLEPLLAEAMPVFEAARRLGDKMAGIERQAAAPETPADRHREFGGLEARRFGRAGVRLTRVALTLEGTMRPGSRLKVAGRLVYPDADGRFRLECVLSGKRTQIPMSAGPSASGEVRGVLNVDWEKRLREKSVSRQ